MWAGVQCVWGFRVCGLGLVKLLSEDETRGDFRQVCVVCGGVYGLGFRVWGLEYGVWGSGFRVGLSGDEIFSAGAWCVHVGRGVRVMCVCVFGGGRGGYVMWFV